MIRVKDLHITQGDFKLSDVNFEIEQGKYVVLMGKTGCGKTTILESICGLREIKSGEIFINHKEVSKLGPAEREIGYMPQDAALFKSMNVYDNIAFALKMRRWEKGKIKERVWELAQDLSIEYLLKRKVNDLSGGEKQRVSLARALSFYPNVLCLDEPLSALDDDIKNEMYDLLLKLKNQLNITVLHISHSKSDAIKLADSVLLFNDDKIKEVLNPGSFNDK